MRDQLPSWFCSHHQVGELKFCCLIILAGSMEWKISSLLAPAKTMGGEAGRSGVEGLFFS